MDGPDLRRAVGTTTLHPERGPVSTSPRARWAPTLLAAILLPALSVPGTTGVAGAAPTPAGVAAPGVYVVALESPPA